MRIRLKYVLPIVQMTMLPALLSAQAAQPALNSRSPEALAVIVKSLAAMMPQGSNVAGSAIKSIKASGTFDKLDATGAWVSGTFTYVDDLDPQRPEYKRSIVFKGKTQTYTSNHGNPSSSSNSAEETASPGPHHRVVERKFEAEYLPYILLYQVSIQPNTAVYTTGPVQLDGKSYIHIETIREEHRSDEHRPDAKDEKIRRDWYFDPETMLPFAYTELLPSKNPAMPWVLQKITFSAYQPVDGLLCPLEQTIAYNSMEMSRIHVRSVEANVQVQAAMFDAPVGN